VLDERPHERRATEVRAAKVRAGDTRSAEISPTEVCSPEVRMVEFRPSEVSSTEVRPTEVCPPERETELALLSPRVPATTAFSPTAIALPSSPAVVNYFAFHRRLPHRPRRPTIVKDTAS
jgi:hypothetical protein